MVVAENFDDVQVEYQPGFVLKTVANLSTIFIIMSIVIGGFVFYQSHWSNWINDTKQSQLKEQLILSQEWVEPTRVVDVVEEPVVAEDLMVDLGSPFSKILIPKIDVEAAVVEGVGPTDLAKGPGHFPNSALPGEVGNFALAGHRIGQGAPFNKIGELSSCDDIIVETPKMMYFYKVLGDDCLGVDLDIPGRYIIKPTDVGVVDPIPWVDNKSEDEPSVPLITLVTCNPEWGNWERLIVHAQLIESKVKD